MAGLDIACLLIYFLGVATIGYVCSRKSRVDSKSYFLGGSNIGWLAIGASLFASNISTEHFIGLAGTGASSGLAVGQFEWLACLILLLLGWLFVPFYRRTGVFTMPEFLERRYNAACRTYLSVVSLIAYVFTKVSVSIYAGAIVLETVLGWNVWISAIALLVATGIYTITGGLRAVIYTDFFQAFVLIGGSAFLTIAAITQVGGLGTLTDQIDADFFNIWKSFDHPDFPWTGILFGAPILGIWYWCTDQMIVQRTLAAKNIRDARKATILAGFLKILPVFILVLPGLAGRVLFPDVEPDKMYATLVDNLLPPGIKGLVVAALLAALMSSLSSVFNSSSTLVVMDFYKPRYPDADEKQLVRAGQIATGVLVVVALAWVPFIGIMSSQLYIYLQSVQAYIAPPIAAVFLAGVLWKRATGPAALSTLCIGFVLGAVRFIAELATKSGWTTWSPAVQLAQINFLHFAIILFVISLAVLILFSLATPKPLAAKLSMFQGATETALEQGPTSQSLMVALSVLLVAMVLALWAYFSPWVF